MKKALLKDSLKEIRNTYKRFISILLMAFLGVGFFAGMRATSPDMISTIDNYFDSQNVYDIQILSTLGLTNDDIQALEQVEGVKKAYGEYSEDVLINYEDTEIVTKVLSIDDINKVALIEGRMPQSKNECLVEKAFCTRTGKKIGDSLTIEEANDSIIKEKEVTIVGTMNSPLYVSRQRDTSKLGSGMVSYNMYLPKESFDSEVYTEVYIELANSKQMVTNSQEYNNYVQEVTTKIEEIKAQRETARYDEVKASAQEKLEEGEAKLQEEKVTANNKLKEAENEIIEGERKLNTAEITLNNKSKEAERKFKLAEENIKTAKAKIKEEEENFKKEEQNANTQIELLNKQKQELEVNLQSINTNIEELQKNLNKINESLNNSNLTQEETASLQAQKENIEKTLTNIKAQKTQLEAGLLGINNGLEQIQNGIKEGKEKLNNAKTTLENNEKELNKTKELTAKQLESARGEINSSKKQLQEGRKTFEINKAEYEEKIKEAEKEFLDAKQKIQEIEHPTWYILGRDANQGYSGFMQDTKSIENLGKVFPIVFFVIATLISLTSMTRMVEEQRVQIGTMKALGYNKAQIASKYLLYSGLACLIGGSIGMIIGFETLPRIIWMMYSMMYVIPNFVASFNVYFAILGLGLASVCIIGASLYTVLKIVGDTPAQLMRPKAPKAGKKILLERIPFIWKHLSFSRKVTVRNIFRYKKRVIMTIVGIAGSTALILTGFGVKDAISDILIKQYENVYNYDMQISLKSDLEETEIDNFVKTLQEKEEINKIAEANMTSGTLVNERNEEDVQIIIAKDEKINELIHLSDRKTKKEVQLEEGKIAITDKVAELLEVKKGDSIILKDADGKENSLIISDVVENYIYHYVYMPKSVYENLYGEYDTNVLFVQNNVKDEHEEELASKLLKEPNVNTVSLSSNIENVMDDMMRNLNYVVIILIVSAGMLAFVVLYNLANINISERIRELASLKVLGFYDKEVYDYVTRETAILTTIGIIFGLIGGYFLSIFIVKTCEINVLRFGQEISIPSYIYSVAITVIFTVIVNIVTYFALKKIDMIESLKSIE